MRPDKARAAAEARALLVALVLAAKAGWHFGRGPLLQTAFTRFLYVEAAQLMLVPTTAGLPFARRQLDPVVRETRSDALIVSRPDQSAPVFAMATWARTETIWTSPLALWLAESGTAWLVPLGDDGDQLGFELANQLHRLAGLPWTFAGERAAGFARAARWVEEVAAVVTP